MSKYLFLLFFFFAVVAPVDAQTFIHPRIEGGKKSFLSIDVDETEEAVKAGEGQIYGYFLYNNAATVRFFKLYDATVATVVVGTTTPKLVIPVPPNSGANLSDEIGIEFDTAITIACTTGVAHSDTGAPSANDCIADLWFY